MAGESRHLQPNHRQRSVSARTGHGTHLRRSANSRFFQILPTFTPMNGTHGVWEGHVPQSFNPHFCLAQSTPSISATFAQSTQSASDTSRSIRSIRKFASQPASIRKFASLAQSIKPQVEPWLNPQSAYVTAHLHAFNPSIRKSEIFKSSQSSIPIWSPSS